MKIVKLLTTVVAIIGLIYSGYRLFAKPNGKVFEIDKKHHVYYKGDGVTEDDAKKTGDYLKEIGLVQSSEAMDVQISSEKPAGDVKFSLVFDKTKITAEAENSALAIGSELSTRVFNGRKVSVAFVDESMDEIKNLGISPQPQTLQTGQQNTNQTDDQK